jgi:hypothetical protein
MDKFIQVSYAEHCPLLYLIDINEKLKNMTIYKPSTLEVTPTVKNIIKIYKTKFIKIFKDQENRSILVHIKNNTYMWISLFIYKFDALCPIKYIVSKDSESFLSDVVFAVDEENNMYDFITRLIKNNQLLTNLLDKFTACKTMKEFNKIYKQLSKNVLKKVQYADLANVNKIIKFEGIDNSSMKKLC